MTIKSRLEILEELPYDKYLEKLNTSSWYDLVDYVTLYEALLWVGLRIAPDVIDDEDVRFCHNSALEFGMKYSYVISEKTYHVEFPDPPVEEFITPGLKQRIFSAAQGMHVFSEEDKAKYNFDYLEACNNPNFDAQLRVWNNKINAYLEPARHELFLKLFKGEISAFGNLMKELTCDDEAAGKSLLETDDLRDYVSWKEATEIEKGFWLFKEIDWYECYASSERKQYASIYLRPKDLLEHFPVPQSFSEILISDNSKRIKSDSAKLETRGRKPKFPWDDFHAEVAMRMMRDRGLWQGLEGFCDYLSSYLCSLRPNHFFNNFKHYIYVYQSAVESPK